MISREFVRGFMGFYPQDGPVNLRSLTAQTENGDTYAANVQWRARKLPADPEWILREGIIGTVEVVEWDLIDDLQSVKPKPGDEIVDTTGKRWNVKATKENIREALFVCLSQLKVT